MAHSENENLLSLLIKFGIFLLLSFELLSENSHINMEPMFVLHQTQIWWTESATQPPPSCSKCNLYSWLFILRHKEMTFQSQGGNRGYPTRPDNSLASNFISIFIQYISLESCKWNISWFVEEDTFSQNIQDSRMMQSDSLI